MSASPGVRHSRVYVGQVQHRRFDAVAHSFRVRAWFVYLDLEELDAAFAGRWWWSHRRPAPMRYRRADYFGDPQRPLVDCIRDAVAAKTGVRPEGPVRMLTNLRSCGFVFNPVSFYYCFDRQERLTAVLAEITNTPWGERHRSVVAAGGEAAGERTLRGSFAKALHVSPFQPMQQRYEWTFGTPGERLAVHMENHAAAGCVFDATLALQARPWSTGSLVRAWLRQPLMAVKVVASIYWHAFVLWCKRAPFHAHPPAGGR